LKELEYLYDPTLKE